MALTVVELYEAADLIQTGDTAPTAKNKVNAIPELTQAHIEMRDQLSKGWYSVPTMTENGTSLNVVLTGDGAKVYKKCVKGTASLAFSGAAAGTYFVQLSTAGALSKSLTEDTAKLTIGMAVWTSSAFGTITVTATVGLSGSGGDVTHDGSIPAGNLVMAGGTGDGRTIEDAGIDAADVAEVVDDAVRVTGDQTIAGTKTFSTAPKIATASGTDDAEAVNVGFVKAFTSDKSWQQPVNAMDLTAPPVSPIAGDRYIIAAGATGAWSGKVNQLAEYTGASWAYTVPENGWTVVNLDDNPLKSYTWNAAASAWVLSNQAAETYTASTGLQMIGNDVQLDPSDTNPGLEVADGGVRVKIDDGSIERSADGLRVKALGVTNAMLAGSIADSKLNEISTANKVNGTALKNLSGIPSGAGIIPPANLGANSSGAGAKALYDDGTWKATEGGGGVASTAVADVDVLSYTPNAIAWTNQPATETELLGNEHGRFQYDAATASQYRLWAALATAGATGATLNLQYSDDDGASWHACDTADAGALGIDATGLQLGDWADLVAGAQADVLFRLVGVDGDAVADPAFRGLRVQFKIPGGTGGSGDMLKEDYAATEAAGIVDAAGKILLNHTDPTPEYLEDKLQFTSTDFAVTESVTSPPGTKRLSIAVKLYSTIYNATAKTTLAVADAFGIYDSVTGLLRKITWENICNAVLDVADLVYAAIDHTHAQLHDRAHDMTSTSDHNAVTGTNKGKWWATDPSTGATILVDAPVLSDNMPGVNRSIRVTLFDPKTYYGKLHYLCLIPQTDAALTITKIEVTCDGDPTTEPTGDLMRADTFIGRANSAVINDWDTANGVRSDSTITNGAVPSGKCVYLAFDAEPDAGINSITWDITYDYD